MGDTEKTETYIIIADSNNEFTCSMCGKKYRFKVRDWARQEPVVYNYYVNGLSEPIQAVNVKELRENLCNLFEEYALEPDENLHESVIQLKRELLEIMEEVE